MSTLQLYVLGIDSLRDIFRSDGALAARLRATAAATFPSPGPARRPGRLPLMRRHPDLVVDPSLPNRDDVDALLQGRFIAEDRQVASWTLLESWLAELSAHTSRVTVTDIDAMEYDLAAAGLPSDHSLRNLAVRELGIPLRPLPGQVTGYSKRLAALETREALVTVLESGAVIPDATRAVAETVRESLDALAASPEADLIVVGSRTT